MPGRQNFRLSNEGGAVVGWVMQRRRFLIQSGAALAATTFASAAPAIAEPRFRFGTCRLNLADAKVAGLEGIEFRTELIDGKLNVANPDVIREQHAMIAETGLPICSIMMGLFNAHPFATDPRAPEWLDQTIAAARELGAGVILVAFFADGDLLDANGEPKRDEIDATVRRLKQAAPKAKDAGVVLALENFLNGEENGRILDRVGHESVQHYYDVYNTGTTKGHDVPADLERLQGRIAQIHFKNGRKYLDDEPEKFEPIAAAIKRIGYHGWIVLETDAPSRDAVADARRNGDYLRTLFA